MKTVLFVPGYQESLDSRNYRATIKAIESQGYRVKFIPITWRRTTIDSWLEELEAVYLKHDLKDTILAGFSFGAMTVFAAAAKRTHHSYGYSRSRRTLTKITRVLSRERAGLIILAIGE